MTPFMTNHASEGWPRVLASDADFEAFVWTQDLPTVVLVSMAGCGPCVVMKPLVRKLAAQLSSRIAFAEADEATVPMSVGRYAVETYPTVLVFRDGVLAEKHRGYPGAEVTRAMMLAAAGLATAPDTEADLRFEEDFARARAALNAKLELASQPLEPHMDEIDAGEDAIDAALCQAVAAGALSKAEAAKRRQEERQRLHFPFRDKIDALRAAQTAALAAYETESASALRDYLEARRSATAR